MSSVSEPRWIECETVESISTILRELGLLSYNQEVEHVTIAGEGNMNVTLRASSRTASWIIKQSRPWVAKYPSIAAPVERILFEQRFYRLVSPHQPVAARMPKLLGSVPGDFLLVLEDLGTGSDATSLYRRGPHSPSQLELFGVVDWLASLHTWSQSIALEDRPHNRELRLLNHAHIFCIPLDDPPAIDLDAVTPGLAAAAHRVRKSGVLARLRQLGELYLDAGDRDRDAGNSKSGCGECLLHGDFFPGSWLRTERGLQVIDPEFCYFGRPEFDLGVLLAHLRFGRFAAAEIAQLMLHYEQQNAAIDRELVAHFSAAEVIRRLIGVAQLPLDHTLDEKRSLLEQAIQLLT